MEISQHFVTFIQTWPKISSVPYPEDLIEVSQSSEIWIDSAESSCGLFLEALDKCISLRQDIPFCSMCDWHFSSSNSSRVPKFHLALWPLHMCFLLPGAVFLALFAWLIPFSYFKFQPSIIASKGPFLDLSIKIPFTVMYSYYALSFHSFYFYSL